MVEVPSGTNGRLARLSPKAIRGLYHRWTETERYGYKPDDRIGYAVLGTVNALCDALDEAREELEAQKQLAEMFRRHLEDIARLPARDASDIAIRALFQVADRDEGTS